MTPAIKSSPRIVFCTTCKGRVEHLKETLPRNISNNSDYENCKFVVVDYCDPGPLRAYLWKNHKHDIRSGKLILYSYFGKHSKHQAEEQNYQAEEQSHQAEEQSVKKILSNVIRPYDLPFHISHAKNLAARAALLEGADIIVTQDADNFTGKGFTNFIADKFENFKDNSGILLCPDFWLIRNLPHGPTRPARGFYGRLVVRSQDFIKVGGYDEIFSMWGSEDADILARFSRLDFEKKHIDNKYLNTIPHTSEVRFKEYPEAKKYENDNYIKGVSSRKETVVNYGHFGVGEVFKNFDSTPIEIKPLPTRIFGIGMQRTATSSLDKAFKILGLDSFHWGAGEVSKIWHDINIKGNSPILERFYAASDLPIPLLYKKLDSSYPNSKFILTLRDENAWISSVERLWSYEYNPTRYIWDLYPISNTLHKATYGQKEFNKELFLKKYRQHNIEVKEYFKNRPNDLLVMNMSSKVNSEDRWLELCQFIDIQVPSVPYPTENHLRS